MNKTQISALSITIIVFAAIGFYLFGFPNLNFGSPDKAIKAEKVKSNAKKSGKKTGQVIDKYKGVNVYYNGKVSNVSGRNTTSDGYNLGLKYQCVEFAKRFYYEVYNHKMPDSYGHAKDFFNGRVKDGEFNKSRNMYQFINGSQHKPKKDDMCVIGPLKGNKFGHLFIITDVNKKSISFIQQNGGSQNPSRGQYPMKFEDGKWTIQAPGLLGWLRMS